MGLPCSIVWFILCVICPVNITGIWWAVGSQVLVEPNGICGKPRRLAGRQRTICRKEPEIVQEVATGIRMALEECQFQFRSRRWNCSNANRAIVRVLRMGTRETAFINALASAGVVHAMTHACSMGDLLQCSCDNRRRDIAADGEWVWGGCGDDVVFGYRKSREFMDVVKRRRSDIKTKLQLHNNEAGRLAVAQHMRTACKCHGLSGSCTLKTCWRKMPPFRDVGARLKANFDGATHVSISNDGKRIIPLGGETIRPVRITDLVYAGQSPDFCRPNRHVGSHGTVGRHCNATSNGVGGCELLCCSRGHRSQKVTLLRNCHCKFHWCCEVICKTCQIETTVHTCL